MRMASSPYRFGITPEDRATATARSRTGLSGIGSGAASGGEGYRQSALRPGSSGFMAAGFGGAPRADYVPPEAEKPQLAGPPPPTLAPAIAPPWQGNSWEAERGGAGIEGGGPDVTDISPDGEPGDLSEIIGDIDIDGKVVGSVLGSLAGGLALGPLGALAGGVAGRAIASGLGGGAPADKGDISGDAKDIADTNPGLDPMGGAGDMGDVGGAKGDIGGGKAGFARGGRVTGDRLMQNKAKPQAPGMNKPKGPGMNGIGNKPKGLDGVGEYMGGFADGGAVGGDPNATDMAAARLEPIRQSWPAPIYRTAPAGERLFDRRINSNNLHADVMTMGEERYPGVPWMRPDPIQALIQARPDLRQAIIGQIGSVHPVNPANPSTGYQGAYASGGSVGRMPGYQAGGEVDALAGPDPAGPDDGFAALDEGEYVVQQQQAQRPDYAPILEEINQGTYQPGQPPPSSAGSGMMPNAMPAEGGGAMGGLPDPMMSALGAAAQADPMIAAALTELLGPESVQELLMGGSGGMDGRPPLSGPPPVPGMASPPGVRPMNQPRPVPMQMGGMM